jgi:hypothetical protein
MLEATLAYGVSRQIRVLTPLIGELQIQLLINGRHFVGDVWHRIW